MPCRMRRMMLIAASWPSNRLAAVTKRTFCVGRYSARALNSADRSVIGVSVAPPGAGTVSKRSLEREAPARDGRIARAPERICRQWRAMPPPSNPAAHTVSGAFVAGAVMRLTPAVRTRVLASCGLAQQALAPGARVDADAFGRLWLAVAR